MCWGGIQEQALGPNPRAHEGWAPGLSPTWRHASLIDHEALNLFSTIGDSEGLSECPREISFSEYGFAQWGYHEKPQRSNSAPLTPEPNDSVQVT